MDSFTEAERDAIVLDVVNTACKANMLPSNIEQVEGEGNPIQQGTGNQTSLTTNAEPTFIDPLVPVQIPRPMLGELVILHPYQSPQMMKSHRRDPRQGIPTTRILVMMIQAKEER